MTAPHEDREGLNPGQILFLIILIGMLALVTFSVMQKILFSDVNSFAQGREWAFENGAGRADCDLAFSQGVPEGFGVESPGAWLRGCYDWVEDGHG